VSEKIFIFLLALIAETGFPARNVGLRWAPATGLYMCVGAQCNLFWLAFSGWPGSAALHFQVCMRVCAKLAGAMQRIRETPLAPPRQMALPNRQNVSISRELDPLTPTHLAGGAGRRGWRDEKMLDVRAFLALRQLPPLAEGGARGVRTGSLGFRNSHFGFQTWDLEFPVSAEVRLPSFPCVRARGKDTPGKSQPLVIYDLKFEKYFANHVANLAKWQTTPASRRAK